ncbi:2-hydroxychromene-2-carboxylate isomerase [Maricaulis sp.]|uniref:2-hydroxychromene-2-carboxylate isomerase n=1 Tax=Maricaulis sp. TaxID=1486257 RepID=UPI002B273FDC|nr:DsbA family protein [Maricaulis sp.]
MTHSIDLFWSFRSPYSYLALPRLVALEAEWDLIVNVRPVRPLALRQPDFFEREDPMWMGYLLTDVLRLADYLGMPIGLPSPDPVLMASDRKRAAPDQPHIHRLTRIGLAAAETGAGLAALQAMSSQIWSGEDWTAPGVLESALTACGLDADALMSAAETQAERLDAVLAGNEAALTAAGHWGVPTLAYKGEAFFGQDRIDLCLWRMQSDGLLART